MSDRIEIDFLAANDTSSPDLEAVRQYVDDQPGFEASWGRDDEYVYVVGQHESISFGVHLTHHGRDSSWYTLPSVPALEMDVSEDDIAGHEGDRARIHLLLSMVEVVHAALDARYAYGFDTNHVGSVGEDWGLDKPVTDESLSENRIAEVSWLMLFGPEMVGEYGREWLLDAPAWKRTELDDGGIMLVASPDPTDYETFTDGREKLREYFGFTDDAQPQ